jgi:hypothetical protein
VEAESNQEIPSPPVVTGNKKTSPGKTIPRPQSGDISIFGLPLFWYIGIILGAILILALIIFLMVKRLQTFPNRTFAHAVDKPPKKPVSFAKPVPSGEQGLPRKKTFLTGFASQYRSSAENRKMDPVVPLLEEKSRSVPQTPVPPVSAPAVARVPMFIPKHEKVLPINSGDSRKIVPQKIYKKTRSKSYESPLLLSLFVEDQNTNIGRRNIHAVKAGYSFTIGGGKSDFLIFLVPMPPRIAELRSDGTQCTLVPRKPEFFPDIDSRQIPDCIGKPIRIISERRYELIMRIDRYEDPLIALNRLLHSVDVPGYRQEPV